jgi:hypothetical protein
LNKCGFDINFRILRGRVGRVIACASKGGSNVTGFDEDVQIQDDMKQSARTADNRWKAALFFFWEIFDDID